MPSVTLVGSNTRRRSSAALVKEIRATFSHPSSTRARSAGHKAAERDWTVFQAALQLLTEKVRAARARDIRGDIGFPGLGYPAIAAESSCPFASCTG